MLRDGHGRAGNVSLGPALSGLEAGVFPPISRARQPACSCEGLGCRQRGAAALMLWEVSRTKSLSFCPSNEQSLDLSASFHAFSGNLSIRDTGDLCETSFC